MKLDYFNTTDFHSALKNVHFPFADADADKAYLFSSDEKIRVHDARVDEKALRQAVKKSWFYCP